MKIKNNYKIIRNQLNKKSNININFQIIMGLMKNYHKLLILILELLIIHLLLIIVKLVVKLKDLINKF